MFRTNFLPHVARTLLVWLLLLFMLAAILAVSTLAAPSAGLTDRQRFGFVANYAPDWFDRYEVGQLRAGWFVAVARSSCILAPEGMERALILSLQSMREDDGSWDLSRIHGLVDTYPHTLWLVGNEPDCIYQDNLLPEEYATVYHDIYALIKSLDSTAQVSPGGIVQPTPLRFQWLDRVLTAYQSQYSTTLPLDVWNIHNAILNEQKDMWGADIPPGINATEGVVRDLQDNDRTDIFNQQIWDFRQWMADNGYGGYPLIITEYGILLPKEFGYDTNRVNAFMDATFEFMQTVTSTTLGDPTDGYRLVQRWAWYSLDEPPYDGHSGFNGNLFDPFTTAMTPFGQNFASHTAAFPALDYVELVPVLRSLPATSEGVTRTVYVDVQNTGTQSAGPFALRLEYTGPSNDSWVQNIGGVGPGASAQSVFNLTHLLEGRYTLSVQVDISDTVTETTECNNRATLAFAVPPHLVYLPLISR